MKKAVLIVLPIIFTAQACNLFSLSGEGSGSRGVFVSTDGADSWEERDIVSDKDSLKNAEISGIFIEQNNPKNLLAATLNKGLYASDSKAEAWVPLLPGFAAYDAFINPFDSQEIFAGGSKNKLAVVFKSGDRGGTWAQIYNQPSGEAAVTALAFDRNAPNILFAGLSTGAVIKSMNNGETWNIAAVLTDRVVRIIVVPDSARTIYVLTRTKGIQRSVDGGATWDSVPAGFGASQFNDLIIPSGQPQTLYLATATGLQRSRDGGSNWTEIDLPTTPRINNITAIAVNPQNVNQIFAAIRFNVYRSDDGGVTWRTHALPTGRRIYDLAIDPSEPNRVYAGVR
ncbi:MAG: hypothetical protein Q8P75_03625 [bacterium]|nr:hypothetical protein [bacterium]